MREMLHHRPLTDKLASTLRLMGFRVAEAYEPCKPERLRGEEVGKALSGCKLRCAVRCTQMAAKTGFPVCREWYEGYVKHIIKMDPSIEGEMNARKEKGSLENKDPGPTDN